MDYEKYLKQFKNDRLLSIDYDSVKPTRNSIKFDLFVKAIIEQTKKEISSVKCNCITNAVSDKRIR